MDSSTFKEPLPEALQKRMSNGYGFEAGAFKPKGYEYIANFGPAGSLAATSTDMARFMIAHLQQGALGEARILKPETVQRHARARLQPPPRRGRVRPRLLRDVHERPADHRARRRHELLPHRARAARGGGRRLLRLRQHRRQGGTGAAALRPRLHGPLLPGAAARAQAPGRLRRAGRQVRRALPRAPPFLHALREGLRPGWEGPPSARQPTTRSSSPACSGTSRSTSRWRPRVVREVEGDRTIAFVEDGKGEVVGMVGQFAFIPFYKLRWYDGSPFHFTLLGLSILLFVIAVVSALRHWKSDKAGPRAGALGAPQPRRARSPQPGLRRGLRVDPGGRPGRADLRGAQGPLRGADPAARRAAAHRARRGPAVRVWREGYWTRASRLFHTAGVVAAIAFVWFLNYWNLLGYRIG